MRGWAYAISCLTAIALVRAESVVLEVVGLALLFMGAFNIGWSASTAEKDRTP